MSYTIKISEDLCFELPSEYGLQDRIDLCDKITKDYPQYFDMSLYNTPRRLEIMANYILEMADKGGEYPLLTLYKEKRNKYKEVTFGDFEKKYDNIQNFEDFS